MMESAEQNGVDEKVQRELAVLLANDAGLEIRFDAHIRSKGKTGIDDLLTCMA